MYDKYLRRSRLFGLRCALDPEREAEGTNPLKQSVTSDCSIEAGKIELYQVWGHS